MLKKTKRLIIMLGITILLMLILKNIAKATTETEQQIIADGTYTIRSAMNTDYLIGVAGDSKDAGANVELQKDSNKESQMFIVKYINNGYYTIQILHSDSFLDVEGASKKIGANVDQWPSNYGGENQQWLIKEAGDRILLYNI